MDGGWDSNSTIGDLNMTWGVILDSKVTNDLPVKEQLFCLSNNLNIFFQNTIQKRSKFKKYIPTNQDTAKDVIYSSYHNKYLANHPFFLNI